MRRRTPVWTPSADQMGHWPTVSGNLINGVGEGAPPDDDGAENCERCKAKDRAFHGKSIWVLQRLEKTDDSQHQPYDAKPQPWLSRVVEHVGLVAHLEGVGPRTVQGGKTRPKKRKPRRGSGVL